MPSSDKIKTSWELAAERFEIPPIVLPILSPASEVVEAELIVAEIVFPDGAREPITERVFQKMREAQKLLDVAEEHLRPLARDGETLKNVAKRLARFYEKKRPDKATYLLATKSAPMGVWRFFSRDCEPERMTLAEALSQAKEHAELYGLDSVFVVQKVPTKAHLHFTADND